jgi:pimeloyl-ACP methyl ester carboxylesterase
MYLLTLNNGSDTQRDIGLCLLGIARPSPSTSTLLLLHEFPSSSYDWHNQVAFLEDCGYGLIVFDLLGYGSTVKPIDPHQYKSTWSSKISLMFSMPKI